MLNSSERKSQQTWQAYVNMSICLSVDLITRWLHLMLISENAIGGDECGASIRLAFNGGGFILLNGFWRISGVEGGRWGVC